MGKLLGGRLYGMHTGVEEIEGNMSRVSLA